MEILLNNDAVANLIRKSKTYQIPSIIATSKDAGMQSMDSELIRLVKEGKISAEEGYMKAFDKKAFEDAVLHLDEKEKNSPVREPGRRMLAMARIDSFLRLVLEQKASDLHFHAGNPPIIRHDGDLIPLPFRSLSRDETQRFLREIMTPKQQAILDQDLELDFAYAVEGVGRFRVNVFHQSRGLGAVFRVIPQKIPSLDELGMPLSIKKLANTSNGLVLVTGPTGSGKTTTLAAILHEINSTSCRHIITIEDPIEYLHKPIQSTITQRQVGLHCESFAAALRSALRESPDVLVVGEMRDFETVSLALSAAETGVLVFGTLHTNSAAKAIDRILDVAPDDIREQVRSILSVLLKGVLAQHLCKRIGGDGRVAVQEILLHTYAVANMIRENKVHQIDAYLQSAENAGTGMQSLDTALLDLVRARIISVEAAMHLANAPETLRQQIRELSDE